MTTNAMAEYKHKWAFSLAWTNVAVVVVDLVALASGPTITVRSALQTLAFTFIYANLTSILAVVILGWLLEKAMARNVALWKVALPGILFFTAAGCLAAQGLLAAAGFVGRQQFWLEYYHTLRFAAPLALVFGLGATAYGTLLGRMQGMEAALHEKAMAAERAQKLAAEARLRSLEAWIHPHFLFNTLNSISALIAGDPARAEQIVGRLATLLRASLDSSNHPLIPLREEMALVESYVDIERARFGEKLHASLYVPAALEETAVPPMSVQSLVENAVKHGITSRPEGGTFTVTAREENGGVRISVRDDGPGFDLTAMRAGHGLDKLVLRLDALFGERARLSVSREDGYSVVEMVVPHA
ncbi:MAG TPA: sensor histidine kinase [Acidobacteriaceae bacterium]|jgi:signal transduction histidine kinase|nr:sensor histidine kinase [Acidobacteriaceae bacterium]